MGDEPDAVPLVVDIKRNALDDGPGIRSVVFFKGCPLRCVWCQNPEALSPRAEIQRDPARCTGCGACLETCPEHFARPAGEIETQRASCRLCGACVRACPTGARRVAGTRYPPQELAALLTRDEPFYRHSGGGVTFSGGEPALHPAYAGEVARLLGEHDIHVLAETAGHFAWGPFAQHLLDHLDTIYFDLKLADPVAHRRYVGPDNRLILDNLQRLVDAGFDDLLVRVPLVPGITATDDNLRQIAAILERLGLARVALLPYNPLWLDKRRALGLPMPYDHDRFMSDEEIDRCRRCFEQHGFELV